MKLSGFLLLCPLLLSNCQSLRHASSESQGPSTRDLADSYIKADGLLAPHEPGLSETEQEDEKKFSVEIRLADHEQKEEVQAWIDYFTTTDRERFQRFLERGQPYKPLIETVLKKHGIPTYFYYLAFIESGFSQGAISAAKAVGFWQFMKKTGERYGLKVNHYVDERRDPIRSTLAAARYLRDLNNVFQSWFLAMSAYNAGESRILRTIMDNGSRDFWHLAKIRALPPETRDYVPKFIAAALIGTHPKKYGFAVASAKELPSLSLVAVPSPIYTEQIAKKLGIPLQTLKHYNPHLIRNVTDPEQHHYKIWLPRSEELNLAALNEIKPLPRLAQEARVKARGKTKNVKLAKRHGRSRKRVL